MVQIRDVQVAKEHHLKSGGERTHAGRSNCCVGSTGLLGRQFAFASYWARVDGTAPRWRGTRSDSSLPIGLEVNKPRRSALYTESFIGPFGGKANDSPCERSETAGQRDAAVALRGLHGERVRAASSDATP